MDEIKQHFELVRLIEWYGFRARLIGGAVRDWLLKIPFEDVDIATTAMPDNIKNIAVKENLKYVDIGAKYGSCRLFFKGGKYEITTLRDEKNGYENIKFINSFETDSFRRDFTMNAIYVDSDEKIYDYHNGIDDIKNHNIVFIGDPHIRIIQDPIRLLRYIRFCAKYGNFHANEDIVLNHVELLRKTNANKIITELIKILSINDVKKLQIVLDKIFCCLFDVDFNIPSQNISGKDALYYALSKAKKHRQLSEKFGLSLQKLSMYKQCVFE